MMKPQKWRQIVGWVAVGFSLAITCLWAFWGGIENFHEGWYYDSWAQNLALMFAQYLSPMLVFMAASLLSVARPRAGAMLPALAGAALLFYFRPLYRTALLLLAGPLLALGVLYWLGRPQPRKLAYALIAGLPLLTLVISGAYPAYLAATRFDDGNLRARLVEGNGVRLIWAPDGPGWPRDGVSVGLADRSVGRRAPDGPGWPRDGVSWPEAVRRCQCLSEDGRTLAATPQNIWRLPTVEEAVRSLTRRGQNSGGVWDAATAQAVYRVTPNKESPLWNVHSKVIYWWTSTPVDEEQAYMIVYNGRVWPREKRIRPGYLAFRCVKEP
jgi:hypothetical protein